MTSCWKTRRLSCACYAETRGDVATLLVLLSINNIAAMVTKNRLDAPLLMTRALRAVRRLALAQKRWITSLNRAKRCRQAFLNGSISWASEEETALADENDRKEAAKLGSQGWAQLRGFRGK